MNKINPEKILKYMQDNDMVDIEDVLNKIETMKNQEILNQHHYAISQGSNVSAKYSCGFSNLLDSSIIVNER